MKTESKYDPLSITTRVRERIEQKANGCTVQQLGKSSSASLQTSHTAHNTKQLQEDFLDLLLNNPQSNAQEQLAATQLVEEKNSQIHGTKESFFPLNKQEVKEKEISKEKNPFELVVQHSALGDLKLKGDYSSGSLVLNINLPNRLEPKEQAMLAKILKIKLSKELNIPLEIKIGCSAH